MIQSGPSHTAQESAPTIQPTTSANLPLRQSRQHVGVAQPKIHDVTEKFTRACNGMRMTKELMVMGVEEGHMAGLPYEHRHVVSYQPSSSSRDEKV